MGEKGGGGDRVGDWYKSRPSVNAVILVSISIYGGGSGGCAFDASCLWTKGFRVPRETLLAVDSYVFLQATA